MGTRRVAPKAGAAKAVSQPLPEGGSGAGEEGSFEAGYAARKAGEERDGSKGEEWINGWEFRGGMEAALAGAPGGEEGPVAWLAGRDYRDGMSAFQAGEACDEGRPAPLARRARVEARALSRARAARGRG